MSIFWKTIALYNSATWIYQIIIVLIGTLLTIGLIYKPRPWLGTCMKVYVIAVYFWIAIVYYFIYCAERDYNNITAIFWIVMAVAWIWDLLSGYTVFERNPKYAVFSYILLLMPFFYPLFSLLRGMSFPEMTSSVMPCSVVTFSIGLLLLFSRKVNLFIVLLLCHWSLIGLTKTYFFNIPEDFVLACTTVPALYFFFKEYFFRNLPKDETKPQIKYINGLLILLCAMIGIVLLSTIFFEFCYELHGMKN